MSRLSDGICSIAAVRCPKSSSDFFIALANEKKLRFEPIASSEYVLLTSEKGPIANMDNVTPTALASLARISYNDVSPELPCARNVMLDDISDCLELLSELSDSYMISAPLTNDKLDRYGLLSKKYSASGYTDYILYPQGYKPDEYTNEFVNTLKRIITNG